MRKPSSPSLPHWWLLRSRAWCRWLLSLVRTTLSGLLVLWRLMWHVLFCYKVFWELVFHFVREVSAALGSWLESCSEDCDGGGACIPVPGRQQPGAGCGELQRLQDASTAVLERLMGLEAEVKYVSTELRAEKLLWSSRYLELLREQQELREQFQEWGRSQGPEAKDTLEMQSKAEAPSADGSDGWCMGDSGWGLQTPSGERPQPVRPDTSPCCTLQRCPAASCPGRASASSAFACFIPRPSSAPVDVGSTQLRRAQQHPGTRASVPRSPWDLRLGHRDKVLLQSGGVGAGTVRYLGVFPDQAEVSVGVELEDPGHGAHDNVLVGHCCFPWWVLPLLSGARALGTRGAGPRVGAPPLHTGMPVGTTQRRRS
nr:uncharacterized protein LOC125624663 [Caretta caretta]